MNKWRHQVKQVELGGRNLEELETRHPPCSSVSEDRDTRFGSNNQNNKLDINEY